MPEIKLPQHNEGQISKVFPMKYSSKYKLSESSDTLPRDNVLLTEVILYQGGKRWREDNAYLYKLDPVLDYLDG